MRWLTLREAADELGISPSQLRDLVTKGEITYRQRAKFATITFREDWLAEYANRVTKPARQVVFPTSKPEPATPKPRGKELDWSVM